MSDLFYRQRLENEQSRTFYDEICRQIRQDNISGTYELCVCRSDRAMEDGFAAIEAVSLDHPEWFFLGRKTTACQEGNRLILHNQILYTPRQTRRIRVQLNRVLERLTRGMVGLSEWERERLIYERVVRCMRYENRDVDHDHNVVGPVLTGKGVCEGFSCLLMLALRKVGIPCIRVSGFGRKELHCWNMAWIGGTPVHLDCTWESRQEGNIGYFYFNLTDAQIRKDHEIHTKGLPVCDDPSYGYFHQTDTVFPNAAAASRHIRRAFFSGKPVTWVKLLSDEDMQSCINRGVQWVPGASYSYVYDQPRNAAMILRQSFFRR